jgi:diguanylate cyclase (GGDEF)-like protein
MAIDQGTLFVAAGVCAVALGLTMLSAWTHSRTDRFLIGWMAGMLLLGCGVIIYSIFPKDRMEGPAVAFTMEIVGFIVVYVAARQFTGRPTSNLRLFALLALVPFVTVPIVAGFDGLGMMVFNLLAGFLLARTGAQYWSARGEAPSSILAMTALYVATAVSFIACGVVLLAEGRWVLGAPPDNWAEHFNAIMCIAGITGVGALSLGLNHARAARRHHEEARTDALTGLLNRRALFDAMSRQALMADDAVIAFDLDRFKQINDRHGHAVGDEVLCRFADVLRRNLRDRDLAARTGGEEFVLVLRGASAPVATELAERIRTLFAGCMISTATGTFSATASAGLAMGAEGGDRFEHVLLRADTSLYRAKDGGRNRVVNGLQAA